MITKARVFFFFVLQTLPTQFFWKLKKNKTDFFQFYFFYFPPTHASAVLELVMFFDFVFSIADRLIKLPPVTAPGEILPFNWKNKIHSDHFSN